MDILLGVTVILRGVSGATIVAADTSANKLSSRKSAMGTRVSGRGRQFRYLPVGVVSEEVVVIWERDGGEGEVNVSD